MSRFATITQTESTTSIACASGVVVPEHGLLERQAGAGVAEDVLDEDEPADSAREQRGEAVQRRQDRVPPRVPRHDPAVAQPFGVRHRHVVLADRVDHHRAHVQHPAARVRGDDDEDRKLGVPKRAGEELPVEARGQGGVIGVLDREPAGLQPQEVEPEEGREECGERAHGHEARDEDAVDEPAAAPGGDQPDCRADARTRGRRRRRRGRSSTGACARPPRTPASGSSRWRARSRGARSGSRYVT